MKQVIGNDELHKVLRHSVIHVLGAIQHESSRAFRNGTITADEYNDLYAATSGEYCSGVADEIIHCCHIRLSLARSQSNPIKPIDEIKVERERPAFSLVESIPMMLNRRDTIAMGLVAFREMATSVVWYEQCPMSPIGGKPSLYLSEVLNNLLNEIRWYTVMPDNSMWVKERRLPVSEALNTVTKFLFTRVKWPSSRERDLADSVVYRGVNDIVYRSLEQEADPSASASGANAEEHY